VGKKKTFRGEGEEGVWAPSKKVKIMGKKKPDKRRKEKGGGGGGGPMEKSVTSKKACQKCLGRFTGVKKKVISRNNKKGE